jgi:hypothetical protein
VRLPPIHETMGAPSQGCRLEADAGILWATNPRAKLYLEIVAQPEATAVQQALGWLGFEAVASAFHWSEPADHVLRKDYSPRSSLRDQLDGATLDLPVDEENVSGNLALNRKQQTIAERVNALFGGDRVDCPLLLARCDLKDEEGQARPERAVDPLRQALADAVALPGDMSRRLLRATSAPEADNTLLRPASSGAQNHEQRLRPASDTEPAAKSVLRVKKL